MTPITRAQKVRTLIRRTSRIVSGRQARHVDAGNALGRVRAEAKGAADPVEMYLNDVFTVTVNMAGLPGIAVPEGLDAQGLPVG